MVYGIKNKSIIIAKCAVRPFALSTVGLLLVACSGGVGEESDAPSAKPPALTRVQDEFPLVMVQGELAHVFSSVDEIARDSTAITVIEVVSISTQFQGGTPYTIAQALVRESVAGGHAIGSTITVGEMGGPTSIQDSGLRPGRTSEVHVLATGGVRPMVEAGVYLMFLTGPGRIGPVEDGAYAPLGAFQGKMLLRNDGKLGFGGDGAVPSGEEFAVSRALDGRHWTEVKAEIERTVTGR